MITKLPDIFRFIAVFSYYLQRNIGKCCSINHFEREMLGLLFSFFFRVCVCVYVCLFPLRLFFSRLGNKLQPHSRRMEMKRCQFGPWGERPSTSTRRWRNVPERSCNVFRFNTDYRSLALTAVVWTPGVCNICSFLWRRTSAASRFALFSQTDTNPSLQHQPFPLKWTPRHAGVQAKWRCFHVKLNESVFRG